MRQVAEGAFDFMSEKAKKRAEEEVHEAEVTQPGTEIQPGTNYGLTPVAIRGFDVRLAKEEAVARQKMVKEMLAEVMQPKVHYDVIPGTNKPTLLKPGSEIVLQSFSVAVVPQVEDLSQPGIFARYRVMAQGIHIPTGRIVGVGVGEASSEESRWKWKKVYREEYDETEERSRRSVTKRKKNGETYTVLQVLQEPADIANTVLKQAKKRAQVDLALTVGACSDMFTQDMEELKNYVDKELDNLDDLSGKPKVEQPKRKEEPKKEATKKSAEPAPEPPPASGGNKKLVFDHNREYNIETKPADAVCITTDAGKKLYATALNSGYSREEIIQMIEDRTGFHKLGEIPVGATYQSLLRLFEKPKG